MPWVYRSLELIDEVYELGDGGTSGLKGRLYRFLHAVSYDQVMTRQRQGGSNHNRDYHIRKVYGGGI